MMIFDIETDGLLDTVTKIHVLVIYDTDTKEYTRYERTQGSIRAGLDRLGSNGCICGHNIIGYDIPAIKKLYPDWEPKGEILDTLVLARLAWADIKMADLNRKDFDKKLIGSHSLKAYGQRLKILKGDFGETSDWSEWSQEMSDYCEQDVRVTVALYEKIQEKNLSPQSVKLEHEVQTIIVRQIEHGFLFDEHKAEILYADLIQKKENIRRELLNIFPPWYSKMEEFVPKKDNKKMGYAEGCPLTKLRLNTFNPGSRDHIAYWLKKRYNWKPTEFTNSGKPKIDETILNSLEYPEAKKLSEYFLLDKRLGQLSDGSQGWLQVVRSDGRIHGYVNSNGAVTGRATHSNPNVAQVPGARSPYGKECRELFRVPNGSVLVGADLSGVELRCLAHFMAKYDNGEYTKEILEGDIHTKNQNAAGLPTRDDAKTFIYALLYGAGDEKIGSIIGKGKQAGATLKRKFFKAIPAMKKLTKAVQSKAEELGYLQGLDGRKLNIRSTHAALNTLLQSAGALLSKQWMIEYQRILEEDHGLLDGVHYHQLAWIHDEINIETSPKHQDIIGNALVAGALKAGEHFNFRCPIEAEYAVGTTWYDVH